MPAVFEANEAAVKQMIDGRRQQQTIFPVETLVVGCIAPGLAMTSHQMDRVFDASDAASLLDVSDPIAKKALPLTRSYKGNAISIGEREIASNLLFQTPFPHIQIITNDGIDRRRHCGDRRDLLTDQPRPDGPVGIPLAQPQKLCNANELDDL